MLCSPKRAVWGPCQAGASVVIYPSGTMYGWVDPSEVPKIIDKHIVEGEVYSDLVASLRIIGKTY